MLDDLFLQDYYLQYGKELESNLFDEDKLESSFDSKIDSSNIGYSILQKQGWNNNTGLGKDGRGFDKF